MPRIIGFHLQWNDPCLVEWTPWSPSSKGHSKQSHHGAIRDDGSSGVGMEEVAPDLQLRPSSSQESLNKEGTHERISRSLSSPSRDIDDRDIKNLKRMGNYLLRDIINQCNLKGISLMVHQSQRINLSVTIITKGSET